MVKYAPQSNEFNTVVKIDKFYSVLLYASIVVSFFQALDSRWEWIKLNTNAAIFFNILIIILIFGIKLYRDYRLNQAENIRRDSLIDNAFRTKLGEEMSIDYYNNDEVEDGYRKLLTNLCQNSYFSVKISEVMFRRSLIPIFLLAIAILGCSVVGFSNILIASPLLQALLSAIFLVRTIQIGFYKHNANSVYEKAKSLLDGEPIDTNRRVASILQLLITYESNISGFQIILDEKTYHKLNNKLTDKWDDIKLRCIDKSAN